MVEELRQQIIEEAEAGLERGDRATRRFLGLSPREHLILALLLFGNVALCGYMGLVMMGRVAPPF